VEDDLHHGLYSSGVLHGIGWYLVTKVSGQHIGTLLLKTEPIGCFETFGDQTTSCATLHPKERRLHMRRGGSLKCRLEGVLSLKINTSLQKCWYLFIFQPSFRSKVQGKNQDFVT